MKRLLPTFAALFLLGTPAAAKESPQSILASDEILNRTKRIELAESLLSDVNTYAQSFPMLTPTERSYIENELNEARGDRLNRLGNSEEFLIYRVRQHLEELQRHLDALLDHELQERAEVKHWAAVSYHLLHSLNDVHNRLRNMGVITQTEALQLGVRANYLGNEILIKTIIEP